ncbi:MAG TPA: hypothetical protein PKA53_07920 [Sphingobacterium sp.]|nr:hypothetical protein [Sphingobacterium sp.]
MKKLIVIITVILSLTRAYAQVSDFSELKNEIEQKAKLNLWDEVLLLASDLIIADPQKGDGLYYTALAFQRLGDEENAKKYIAKARTITDEALHEKISNLEKDMAIKLTYLEHVKDAVDHEIRNQKEAAANSWKMAWELDKTKLEYALNAVSHYIDLKKYEQALALLDQPDVRQDQQARNLIVQLSQTPEIVAKTKYHESMTSGNNYFQEGHFKDALVEYEKALRIMPNDKEALKMVNTTREEDAWYKARESNFIDATEKYINQYPNGKYLVKAKEIMKTSYLSLAKSAYDKNDIDQLATLYSKFSSRFPDDTDISTIEGYALAIFMKEGDHQFRMKNWNGAEINYQKYLSLSESTPQADYIKRQLKRVQRIKGQKNKGYFMLNYATNESFGFEIGKLKVSHKVAAYFDLNVNKNVFGLKFSPEEMYLSPILGEASLETPFLPANTLVPGFFTSSFGFTMKIVYPLWAYAGGGVRYQEYIDKDNDVSYKFAGEDSWQFLPEFGLKTRIGNALILKAGMQVFKDKPAFQFGIAF